MTTKPRPQVKQCGFMCLFRTHPRGRAGQHADYHVINQQLGSNIAGNCNTSFLRHNTVQVINKCSFVDGNH